MFEHADEECADLGKRIGSAATAPPGVDEERHGHTERVRESAERIGLRLAQVVFIPRQRRLLDSGLVGQLGLGEAMRSAGRLQDLAKITVWVPKVTCRVVLGTQTVIFPPARRREPGSTGRDVAAHPSPPLHMPEPGVAARDVGVDEGTAHRSSDALWSSSSRLSS